MVEQELAIADWAQNERGGRALLRRDKAQGKSIFAAVTVCSKRFTIACVALWPSFSNLLLTMFPVR